MPVSPKAPLPPQPWLAKARQVATWVDGIGRKCLRWGSRLAPGFDIDLRSLAVFRVGLGLAVMLDAFLAMTNAEMFLSDAGFLPLALLFERHWPAVTSWSLHALSGQVEVQIALLALQVLAALWLIAGWRTRVATFVCWVLVCSLETRNPVITNGADAMTRLLLFWGLFLPLGARWSLDAWRARASTPHDSPTLRSIPGAALLLQVAFVYWFSVLCKTHATWWGDGSALVQTLQLDLFARPLGVWLRSHADLCQWLTYGWLNVEALGPLLAFLPFWRTGFRVMAVALFFAFHLGIELTMDIGAFPFVMIVAWSAFLPGAVWDRFVRGEKTEKPPMDTNGHECGEIVASRSQRRTQASPQTNTPGQSAAHEPKHSCPFVSVRGSKTFPIRPSRLANAFCVACLAFVFLWNLRGTNFNYWEKWFPRSVNPVAFALRLDQHWSMFAPRPTTDDGWFLLRAGMSDGSELDLLRDGAPADFNKPTLLSATFKDARWQKLITNLWLEQYRHLREPFGDAMARRWNDTHGALSQVVAWQLWLMLEPTLPDGTAGPVRPTLLFERERFGSSIPLLTQEDNAAASALRD